MRPHFYALLLSVRLRAMTPRNRRHVFLLGLALLVLFALVWMQREAFAQWTGKPFRAMEFYTWKTIPLDEFRRKCWTPEGSAMWERGGGCAETNVRRVVEEGMRRVDDDSLVGADAVGTAAWVGTVYSTLRWAEAMWTPSGYAWDRESVFAHEKRHLRGEMHDGDGRAIAATVATK